jgi:HEAT repeat protein
VSPSQRPDVDALEAAGDVPGLIRALGFEADPAIRFWAAVALGRLADREALGPLGELLSDRMPLPRRGAAAAMGRLGDRRATPLLLAALGDGDPEVRKSAVQALGELGDPAGVPALRAALEDHSWLVRCHAAEALGRLADTEAVAALIAMLDDTEELVRNRAARALGVLDTPDAKRALAHFRSDSDLPFQSAMDVPGYPGGETGSLLEAAVDELVALIDCEIGRIPASDASVLRAREIGARLHGVDGAGLMEQTMEVLRARRPLWHELVAAWWDGIGGWRY